MGRGCRCPLEVITRDRRDVAGHSRKHGTYDRNSDFHYNGSAYTENVLPNAS